ncbi:protein ANTI-SILENCING 1-like [Apium graveolens]|uniref:protein ANTI-SILENCING 1-like n=1 Tax=Apium graveolens TaxID=4045 RepID=UPI003D796272
MTMVEVTDVANLEFMWGKKRGIGGKKKEVQFYESFTYDGVDYNLYDSVYMVKEGEPEFYIGKLIKIWECGDKTKKVKVQWFFQPSEILRWLGDVTVLENEIFLATGEGVGLANVNPLEAIAGKCNVVCTSKDSRNHQPSEEELQLADYIFYRTFDVGSCTILDKMDDKVGGTEVRFVFNKKESEAACAVPEHIPDKKDEKECAVACNGTQQISKETAPDESKSLLTNGFINQSVAFSDVKDVTVKGEYLTDVKPASVTAVEFNTLSTSVGQPASLLSEQVAASNAGNVKDESEMATDTKVKAGKRPQPANFHSDSEEKPSKKAKNNDVNKSSFDKSRNNSQKLVERGNDVKTMSTAVDFSAENAKSGSDGTVRQEKDKPSKQGKVDCPSKEKNTKNIEKGPSNMEKLGSKTKGLSSSKLPKRPARKERESDGKIFDVTERPDVDNSKWFRQSPFEDRVEIAQKDGTILMLHNLDPEYVSGEVENIIWHALKEHCSAKMVQRTKISTPHSGQAIIIFKSREGTERVMTKLNEGCLMLPNGRPLVCSTPSTFPGKQSTFYGHLVIDNKTQGQRGKKDAVSTSHCSQPNTIEYDMAMEWCLHQARSDSWWKGLYKSQGVALRKLKATFKSK